MITHLCHSSQIISGFKEQPLSRTPQIHPAKHHTFPVLSRKLLRIQQNAGLNFHLLFLLSPLILLIAG